MWDTKKELHPNVSLAGFITFVDCKVAELGEDARYVYANPMACPFSQYFKAVEGAGQDVSVSPKTYSVWDAVYQEWIVYDLSSVHKDLNDALRDRASLNDLTEADYRWSSLHSRLLKLEV